MPLNEARRWRILAPWPRRESSSSSTWLWKRRRISCRPVGLRNTVTSPLPAPKLITLIDEARLCWNQAGRQIGQGHKKRLREQNDQGLRQWVVFYSVMDIKFRCESQEERKKRRRKIRAERATSGKQAEGGRLGNEPTTGGKKLRKI